MRSLKPIDRRRFLRGAGALVALPFLESIPLSRLAAAVPQAALASPRRLVCMGVALGMNPDSWFPKTNGFNYEMTRLLKPIESLREHFTLISGTDHPGVTGGHKGAPAFLSGNYKPERIGQSIVVRNTITFDQLVAQHLGQETRFESLQFSATPSASNNATLSWTRKGVALQAEGRPAQIFRNLFLDSKDPSAARKVLDTRRSVLDLVMEDAKRLGRQIAREDQGKLDDYLSSVRDVEKRIAKRKQWVDTPKPKADPLEQEATTFHENMDLILELTALAIQTDSTRVLSVEIPGGGLPIEVGNLRLTNYHGQSHHGKDPKVLEELIQIELMHMRSFAQFFKRLKDTPDGNGSLLDHTHVLLGSGLGNGSSHSNRDLPIMLAGGGLRHGQNIVPSKDTPLCDLYVSIMQRLGMEVDQFSNSEGNLNEFIS